MDQPGIDLYDWESEMAALEDELAEDPAGALPDLDRLVARMLEETGYALDDPVAVEGDEREIVDEYLAAHEIALAVERGSDQISPGDIAAAINGFRAVFDSLVADRATGEEPGA